MAVLKPFPTTFERLFFGPAAWTFRYLSPREAAWMTWIATFLGGCIGFAFGWWMSP